MSIPDWKESEIAVAEFIKSIGSTARVTHDKKVEDIHTGYPRQRDVWVEWDFGGHFPAKALISCKFWSTKLDAQDIDHFNGEFISSGAQIGILYSRTGYSEQALEKAKLLRFHCCQLYRGQAPDIPSIVSFALAYNFRPEISFTLSGNIKNYNFKTWNEPLSLEIGSVRIKELLVDEITQYQAEKDRDVLWERTQKIYESVYYYRPIGDEPFDVYIRIRQKPYRAKIEYTRVSGSYNLTHGKFIGSQATPWIDTQNSHPGEGWEETTELPKIAGH